MAATGRPALGIPRVIRVESPTSTTFHNTKVPPFCTVRHSSLMRARCKGRGECSRTVVCSISLLRVADALRLTRAGTAVKVYRLVYPSMATKGYSSIHEEL